MSYVKISKFGKSISDGTTNPLSYCINGKNLDQAFLHGSSSALINGQSTKPCQLFLSQYCAQGWDEFCEIASKNQDTSFPNNVQCCLTGSDVACKCRNAGEVLIRNTAYEKYMINMIGAHRVYEPFDPTVANSPNISYWVSDYGLGSDSGIPIFGITAQQAQNLDSDIVMNKILDNPIIAIDILLNIYNTMKIIKNPITGKSSLELLIGTRLGNFFNSSPFFIQRGGMNNI